MKIHSLLGVALLLCLFTGSGFAQTPAPCDQPINDFNVWLSCKVEKAVKAKLSQRENTRQTEGPRISDSSTSLVDQSKASDLIGAALNLVGVTDNNGTEQRSFAFTASGYSLYSAFANHNPLDPDFYMSHAGWRRFWFTLGREIPANATGANEEATIAGLKVLLIDKRDLRSHNLAALTQDLADANPNYSLIAIEIQKYLFRVLGPALGNPREVDFLNNDLGAAKIATTLALLKEADTSAIDRIIEDRIIPEVRLTDKIRAHVSKITRAPQLSLAFQTKTRKLGIDEYQGQLIFDYGVDDRINLTLNGAFEYKDSKIVGGDVRAASFAGQLQFQITPERGLVGRSPIYFYLSGEGKWMSGMDNIAKGQAKIKIPIADGIDLPISVTFANRTELIDEKEVRGQFGFTFDIARLVKTLGFR